MRIEPRHSRAAWLVWGALQGTIGLALACSGVPSYVKSLLGLGAAIHAWLMRPRRAAACRLDGAAWHLRIEGHENRHILIAATYTRHWAELVLAGATDGPRRVHLWRDALTPRAWRTLIVHLREVGADTPGAARAASRGEPLDVRRHDE